MKKRHLLSACMTALLSLPLSGAQAGMYDDTIRHSILPGWQEADGAVIAAFDVQLAPGWKTYWRAPGEGGIPPMFDWSASDNLARVDYLWPAPHVFDREGLRSIGYKEGMLLPLRLTPKDPSKPITLRGQADIGVCQDICMPVTLPLNAALPLQGKRNPQIAAAMAAIPFTAKEAGVRDVQCDVRPDERGLTLTAAVKMPFAGGHEDAVIEVATPQVWVDVPHSQRQGDTLYVQTTLSTAGGGAVFVNRSEVTITVIGSKYTVEIDGCK